jgi:hypothetical protein
VPGDTGRTKQLKRAPGSDSQAIHEYERSNPGKANPVILATEYTKVRKKRVNGVLCYLMGTSTLAVGAVIIAPNQIVEGTVLAMLAGSFGFAKFLIGRGRKSK